MSIDKALDSVKSLTNTISTGVNTVTRAAADLGLADISGRAKFWMDTLRPASYRGISFGVFGGESHFGRRNAVHEYPYRDTVWVEDLGRSARRIVMGGFLVGADVIAQREKMIHASEAPGDGELVHPTLGRLTVSLMEFSTVERWDQGRVFELNFVFIEAGKRTFPAVATSTADAVKAAATAADAATAGSFASSVSNALKNGAAVVKQSVSTAAAWANKAQKLANDATNLYNMVGRLKGNNGRFFGGRGAASGSISSVQGLIAAGSVAAHCGHRPPTRCHRLPGSWAYEYAKRFRRRRAGTCGGSLWRICRPCRRDPFFSTLSDFTPADTTGSSAIGAAMATMQRASGDLFRRAAVVALARASSDYQPASAADAVEVRNMVCDALDREIEIAGDQGEDATFNAMRRLRAAVVKDLTARGAGLPGQSTIQSMVPVPAPVLAQRLYRDAARGDELVAGSDSVHPAFLPVSFKALST